jgi:putative lipoic acid-binding regulatory protein
MILLTILIACMKVSSLSGLAVTSQLQFIQVRYRLRLRSVFMIFVVRGRRPETFDRLLTVQKHASNMETTSQTMKMPHTGVYESASVCVDLKLYLTVPEPNTQVNIGWGTCSCRLLYRAT